MKVQNTYSEIYQEMISRNEKKLWESGINFDPQITPNSNDTRKGIALFSFGDFYLTDKYHQLIKELHVEFPKQITYKINNSDEQFHGTTHFTFIQLEKVDNNNYSYLEGKIPNYKETLKDIIWEMEPWELEYCGVIAIPSGLLMYGYPNMDINSFRELIRSKVQDINEPYKTDIAHSTLLRLCKEEQAEKLLKVSKKYQNEYLGYLKIETLYLGIGSWKMNQSEIDMYYKFDLKGKRIYSLKI